MADDLVVFEQRLSSVWQHRDHLEKLAEPRDLGMDQFNIYLMHDAKEETLAAYGEEIMPAMGMRTAV